MMWIRNLIYMSNFEILLLLIKLTQSCGLLINDSCTALANILQYSDKRIDTNIQKIPESPFELKNQLKILTNCHDRKLEFEIIQYSNYWLLKNYVRGRLSKTIGCAQSITYTTNADYTFLDNLVKVVERWLGPVSLALYAPGYDFNATMDSIQYLRNCIPESNLIQDYVTFHIYFPKRHMPSYVPKGYNDDNLWPFDCEKHPVPPYKYTQPRDMYRSKMKLQYPINVGRNIARKSANTYFILASDIELYPSKGFPTQFLKMILNNTSIIMNNGTFHKFRVFPLPVFEITKSASIPDNKLELLHMLKNKTAFSFHLKICNICHAVPGYKKWLHTNFNQYLKIVRVSKREGRFRYWEPFYVSDNFEPMFDERISWEGQYSKRIQNYAMCLLNYEYHVLHPHFLVHAPGVKKFNKKDPRLKFVPPTRRLIEKVIIPEYRILYGRNRKCKI